MDLFTLQSRCFSVFLWLAVAFALSPAALRAEKLPFSYQSYACLQTKDSRSVVLKSNLEKDLGSTALLGRSRTALRRLKWKLSALKSSSAKNRRSLKRKRSKQKQLRRSLTEARLLRTLNQDCQEGIVRSSDGRAELYLPASSEYEFGKSVALSIEQIPKTSADKSSALSKHYRIIPSGIIFSPSAKFVLKLAQNVSSGLRDKKVGLAIVNEDRALSLRTSQTGRALESQLPVSGTLALAENEMLSKQEQIHSRLEQLLYPLLPAGALSIYKDGAQLNPGDVVAEPQLPFAKSQLAPFSHITSDSSLLYYINLAPGTPFQHPGLFVLYNKAQANFQIIHSLWWPEVNGRALLERPVLNKTGGATGIKQDPVRANKAKPLTEEEQKFFESYPAADGESGACKNLCEGTQVLILSGAKDLFGFDQNRKALAAHFRQANFEYPEASIRDWDPRNALEFKQELQKLKKDEGCWCEVIVYMTSHGFDGGLAVQPDSKTDINAKEITYVLWEDILEPLKEVCAKKMTLVIDSCRAGGIIEEIESRRRSMVPRLKRIKEARAKGENVAIQELTLRNDFGGYLCANFDVLYSADERHYNYFYTREEYEGGDTLKPGLFVRSLLSKLGEKGTDVRNAGDEVAEYYDSINAGPYTVNPGRKSVKKIPGNWECCERCCCEEEFENDLEER